MSGFFASPNRQNTPRVGKMTPRPVPILEKAITTRIIIHLITMPYKVARYMLSKGADASNTEFDQGWYSQIRV
jgi:hypothetical protein